MTALKGHGCGESVLRAWGMHWRARLEGCPKERLERDREVLELKEGDVLAHIEAMRVLHPRLTYEEAVEATKYGPVPRCHPLSFELPSMADLERQVSLACAAVGSSLWERYWLETEVYPTFPGAPSNAHQGNLMARIGVRYLVRQVYVIGAGTRSNWPGSSFDWLYPYAAEPCHRNGNGRESTVRLVRSEIDGGEI